MRSEFIKAIKSHQTAFGLELADETVERFADYFDLIQLHNAILHLVAPCSPEEFAIRHILESLVLLKYLPKGVKFADIGAGAGLPAIPCLLVRDDLRAVLIESKEKKAAFLDEAVSILGIETRAKILSRQFTETDPSDCQFVTCRALDKLVEKLPRLISWSKKRPVILFAGPNVRGALVRSKIKFDESLIPMSERRFIFVTGQ